jgi:hypothetical protein
MGEEENVSAYLKNKQGTENLWRRLRKPDPGPATRAGRKITYDVLSHGSKILAAARTFGPAENHPQIH